MAPVLRGGFCGQGLSSWWQPHVVLPVAKFHWQREHSMPLLSHSVCQLVKPNESATCHFWYHLCQLSSQILMDLFKFPSNPRQRTSAAMSVLVFSSRQTRSECVGDGLPFQTRTLSLFSVVVLPHFVWTQELDWDILRVLFPGRWRAKIG